MSAGKEQGRFRQRERTRVLLVKTASELMQSGEIPTVTAVAEAAQVSRRTAYRYFPSQEQLLVEAAIKIAQPLVSNTEFPEELTERVRLLVETVQRFVFGNQSVLRTFVRLTADHFPGHNVGGAEDSKPVRRNRVEWIRTALEPARKRLGGKDFERLISALSLCVGIESVMVLTNLRGLSQKEAMRVSLWAAETLVAGALEQAEQGLRSGAAKERKSHGSPIVR
jgi:AcrR family transcriptional regulator